MFISGSYIACTISSDLAACIKLHADAHQLLFNDNQFTCSPPSTYTITARVASAHSEHPAACTDQKEAGGTTGELP